MISTMFSGTAGTSLPQSRRPPARAPWPGSPHPAGVTADPDTVKCASPAARQSPAQAARRLCPPAAPAATGLLARPAARPSLTHEPAPVDVPGPVPRRAAGVTGTTSWARSMRTAPRRRRRDAPVPVWDNDRAGERRCLAWPSGDSRTTRAPSGCRQLVVLCRSQACTSPDAVVAGAGLTGRMLSRRRRRCCRPAPHRAQLCSPRWCGCRRAHG